MRNLLDSESKRGDAAELGLRESQLRVQQQDRDLDENRTQLTAAAVQLAALEAALQEKMDQVSHDYTLYTCTCRERRLFLNTSLASPPCFLTQLEEVRDLYRELHTQLERITEFYQNNTQQVIDAVAKHHNTQADVLHGTSEV